MKSLPYIFPSLKIVGTQEMIVEFKIRQCFNLPLHPYYFGLNPKSYFHMLIR